jgi:hypothetical protein
MLKRRGDITLPCAKPTAGVNDSVGPNLVLTLVKRRTKKRNVITDNFLVTVGDNRLNTQNRTK